MSLGKPGDRPHGDPPPSWCWAFDSLQPPGVLANIAPPITKHCPCPKSSQRRQTCPRLQGNSREAAGPFKKMLLTIKYTPQRDLSFKRKGFSLKEKKNRNKHKLGRKEQPKYPARGQGRSPEGLEDRIRGTSRSFLMGLLGKRPMFCALGQDLQEGGL